MTIKLNNHSFFVFDLDDTLYNEIDFLKSGYHYIASLLAPHIGKNIYEDMWAAYAKGSNVFALIIEKYGSLIPYKTVNELLDIYRYHTPAIQLHPEADALLKQLKNKNIPIGLITDGRSISQRNKLKALGITDIFTDIIISEEFGSEKPNKRNYLYFQDKHPGSEFYFFGDNTAKDFIVPMQLGWNVACIKNNGNNIHLQETGKLLPSCYVISSFKEINFV